jgi:hypothetical protein
MPTIRDNLPVHHACRKLSVSRPKDVWQVPKTNRALDIPSDALAIRANGFGARPAVVIQSIEARCSEDPN